MYHKTINRKNNNVRR